MKGSPGISAVIFDMDGLMLDTEPLYKVAWQQASTELGYELDDTSYLKLVGRPTPDCEEKLIKQFGDGFPLADCRHYGPYWTLWPLQEGGRRCPRLNAISGGSGRSSSTRHASATSGRRVAISAFPLSVLRLAGKV